MTRKCPELEFLPLPNPVSIDLRAPNLTFPRQCPTPAGRLADMKNRMTIPAEDRNEELIACFGEARLVRVNGQIQLRGGSMADRAEALEWLALFLPEEAAGVRR
jgi:hypothetical protein